MEPGVPGLFESSLRYPGGLLSKVATAHNGGMNPVRMTNVCMVEPAAFGFNAETARSNRFQRDAGLPAAQAAAAARVESAALASALRAAGIGVAIAADTSDPPKPDAVFPNNWVSFHADGTVVLYPMFNPSRRAERREAVIDCVKAQLGFVETRRLDLTAEENHGRFLEGTGSLVLDHANRMAYAVVSPRTDPALVREWARLMDYEPVLFDAATPDGTPVYHTNVVLWIGARVAGAGLEWVPEAQRAALRARLATGQRGIMALRGPQLLAFAGNMLELTDASGSAHLAMSASAAACLDENQHAMLRDAQMHSVVAAVPVIETLGGGSVRCMLAEVPGPTGKGEP